MVIIILFICGLQAAELAGARSPRPLPRLVALELTYYPTL